MVKIFLAVLCLLLCWTFTIQAQKLTTTNAKAEKLYHKADEYARARDFNRALEALSDAVKKDPDFAEAYIRAANLYKILGNKSASFGNLKKGLELMPFNPSYANYYFDLADLYMGEGAYEAAKKNFELYLKANPKNAKLTEWAKNQIKSADYAMEAIKNPVDFKPIQLSSVLNKFGLQYFPYTTADQRYFIYTARTSPKPEHDENIYLSERKGEGWGAPVSISSNINTQANEGAATISGDGKTLVFTSCNRPDGIGDCDLYISFKTGNEWSKPMNMGPNVNSRAWDSQPSLSADGRTIYFSSNRGGGLGKEDLWVTYQQEDGSWKKPVNMGSTINTPERDMSPAIHISGSTLYFVSDGRLGLGGLDVYKSSLDKNSRWSEPQNLGYPLNTSADEGSLFISPDNNIGYYSRQVNTDSGQPTIQLFEFKVPKEVKSSENSTYAQGRVFDAISRKPLAAQVQLYNVQADSLSQQVYSDKVTGEYTIVLTEGNPYALYVNASGYMMNSLNFDYTSPKSLSPVALDVYLEPIKTGAAVVLNNLFFDTGKYELEKKSMTELNKLIKFMKQNSKVRIEISGHTDDIGADKDNQVLSERRAKSVVNYLEDHGISKDRIRYRGYGETKPVQPNTSDDNRQLNRRIEMKIL
jgi:OmpA-OmpF porin, OOP family